jgi:hypothetical protein
LRGLPVVQRSAIGVKHVRESDVASSRLCRSDRTSDSVPTSDRAGVIMSSIAHDKHRADKGGLQTVLAPATKEIS